MKNIVFNLKKERRVLRRVLRSLGEGGSLACALKPWRKRGEGGLVRFFILCTLIFVANTFSMRITEKGKKVVKPMMQRIPRANQYLLYGLEGPDRGIWIDKEFVKNNSNSIKMMIEDIGGELNEIPLNYPIHMIKLAFNVLGNKVSVDNFSLEQLIIVANVFNFLDVPADKMKVILARIKEDVVAKSDEKKINELLKELNPDLQKGLLLDPTINFLKDFIMKKFVNNRKQVLVGHSDEVMSIALSHDGTRIVSGSDGNQNNLIVWDISNPHDIKHHVLVGNVYSVALSHDCTKIVSGGYGRQNNLIVWDISNLNDIKHHMLVGHPWNVRSVTLSHDGTKIVSGGLGNQNNLIVWDISNLNDIKHHVLVGHPEDIYSVALSHDGTKIVSGGYGHQNNLIVWDISNLNDIKHHVLVGHPNGVYSVALGNDGTKIVSGCAGNQNNLIVWDVSNLHDIKRHVLVGHPDSVNSVALSHDGTKIVSGGRGDQNNLIVWDISNLNDIKHHVLVGHPSNVNSVVLSHDDTKIISGGEGDQNNLIVWDISDLNDIKYHELVGHPATVMSVVLSHDGTKIVSGCRGDQNNLIVWTLLTDQEKILLHQLKGYNVDQLRLIYLLCLNVLKGRVITLKQDSEEFAVFKTLPQDMQKLLTDLFITKGWFSGWW